MTIKRTRQSHSDDGQGDSEARTEAYNAYDEGVPEQSTQPVAESNSGATSSAGGQADAVRLGREESILYAKKYLEDLLSFFGLNTDVYATTEDDEVIELEVPSTHLNAFLIGQRGETMRALQFLVSSALKNNYFEMIRVNVDVADYKKQRAHRLEDHAQEWLDKVKKDSKPLDLPPMNAADRRVIHKLAGEHGLATESVGEGYDRHIILKPSETN